jgi:hypothetical protein
VDKLKLFVVGETSGDPSKWHPYGGWSLVLAHDKNEALAFDDSQSIATEVSIDEPTFLCHVPLGGDI